MPIRSISRSIAVLQAINRHGSLSLMDIARMSRLPYPTACRIIQTLMHEGLVECESTRKCYRATGLVGTLSQGFVNQDRLVMGARPSLVALTRKIGWPVAISTRIGQSMMIRDTTHDMTALTASLYAPGYTMPLLECAAGQVYFSHLDADQRHAVLASLDSPGRTSPSLPLFRSEETIARIRDDGFATCERGLHTADPGTTSSIGVPLHDGEALAGALTLVFFAAAMPMAEAVERYLPDLKETATRVAKAVEALPPASRKERVPRARRASSRALAIPA